MWQNYVLLNQRYSLVLFDELWQMVYLLSRDILSTFGQIVANDVHLDQRHSWVLLNKLWQMMYIWYIRDIHEYFLTSCSKWCTSRLETFLGTLWRVVANILINSKREKKIWNRVDCQRSEKKIQNTQEIKRTLFNWTKQDKTYKFSRKSSFSSYVQEQNWKTKINSTYLVSVST